MRWRIALLLLLLAASAGSLFSQTSCTAIGPVVPTARPNGHAELMGDIILSCSGSFSGHYNFMVYLNTPVTSHALTTGPAPSLEALLLVNDPDEGSQIACAASMAAIGNCPAGSNVFQAALYGAYGLAFWNVSLPASGPFFLRITNVRADAASLSGPFKPVTAQIAATGIPITTPLQTIAYADASSSGGINVQLRKPDLTAMPVGGLALSRYVALNPDLAANASSSTAPDGVSFVLRITENFGTAFKKMAVPLTIPPDVNTRPAPAPQDVPGMLYNTETGFYNPLFPATDGLNAAGLATQATRIWIRFQSPIGVQVHAPVYEAVTDPIHNSRVRLVWSNADGSGLTYSPIPATSSGLGTYYDFWHMPYYLYVYEITAKGNALPYAYDTIDLPFYLAHLASSWVGLGTTSVQVSLAPISSDNAYVPRFADVSVPITVATTTGPALRAVIGAQTGPQGARIWQVGIYNYGTGTATNVRLVSGLTLWQSSGLPCVHSSPPVVSGIPATLGSIPANSTTYSPVTINFSGCPVNAKFIVFVPFTADGLGPGLTPFFNQTQ